jgi:PAT family acetyl-CoA transporter-like MFS transporter 1
VLYLISAIPIAAYVYFTPRMLFSNYYYPLLILLLGCNEFVMVLRFSAQVGFFASISEPRIGGTYMTLLVTLHNLGFALHSSVILYAANWLPKRYAFVIAVGVCVVLGIIWLGFSLRTLRRLQTLPTYEWYLIPETITDDATTSNEQGENDHDMSLISNKEKDEVI